MTTVYLSESLDFTKVCRCCLESKGEMKSLFGTCLDNMFKTVANIDISDSDGLPQQMCVRCVLQVSRAFTFRQQCERSDKILKLYISQEVVVKDTEETNELIPNTDDEELISFTDEQPRQEQLIHHEEQQLHHHDDIDQHQNSQQIQNISLKFNDSHQIETLGGNVELQVFKFGDLSNMVGSDDQNGDKIYIINTDNHANAIACSVDDSNGQTITFEEDNDGNNDEIEHMMPIKMDSIDEQSVEILTENYGRKF